MTLEDYRDHHKGNIIYVAGCGPSLLNWNPLNLRCVNGIFVNSAVHYLERPSMDWNPNTYRVLWDLDAIDKHFQTPLYAGRAPYMPQVPTFIPQVCWEKSRKLPERSRLLASLNTLTVYGDNPRAPYVCELEPGLLWKPTLFSAISLAIVMGSKDIRLIGADWGCIDGRTHWDQQKHESGTDENCRHQRSIMLTGIMPWCEERGINLTRWHSPGQQITIGYRTAKAEAERGKRGE